MKRVTATEASRAFSRILDEAEHEGESFVVERHGRPVAEIRPATRRSTAEDLLRILRAGAPDPEFESDMREILADRESEYPPDRFADG